MPVSPRFFVDCAGRNGEDEEVCKMFAGFQRYLYEQVV
jgi:hypothetical protein